jgi:hypothetical protein
MRTTNASLARPPGIILHQPVPVRRAGRSTRSAVRVETAASTLTVETLAPLDVRVADEVRVRGTTA